MEIWGGEMVSFLVAYICIREYSGGYHARTTGGCFACTVVVAIGVSVFLDLIYGITYISGVSQW